MKNVLRLILLCLGLSLFGWFIHQAGPAEIARGVGKLGWLAPLVLAPYAVVYLFDTLGWYCAFGSYALRKPSFPTLLRTRWAGESVNNVIPSAYIGGEALKVYLLHKRGIPTATGTTSVVASKTSQVLAQVLFIGLGALAAQLHLPSGSAGSYGMISVTALALLVVALLFWLQHHGLFSSLRSLATKLPFRIRALEDNKDSLRDLDDQIFRYYHHNPQRFALSTLSYLFGWLTDALEIFVVCHLLGYPLSWTEAIAIEAFIGVAKALGIFVPAALGVQESGVVLLFHLFGLPAPLGVSYAIIRRGREVIYVSIGGALLYSEETSLKSLSKRVHKQPAMES